MLSISTKLSFMISTYIKVIINNIENEEFYNLKTSLINFHRCCRNHNLNCNEKYECILNIAYRELNNFNKLNKERKTF